MNRNLIIGFAGGLAFAAFVVLGIIAADALTDEGGGESRLPAISGDTIDIAAGRAAGDMIDITTGSPATDITTELPVGPPVDPPRTGLAPIETVGGVFGDVPVDSSGVPTGEDLVLVDGPILATIALPGLPETPFPDFYFDFPLFTGFLFVDSCADDSGLPGCPAGVGGTVLAPLDGGLDSLGDFRLGTRLGSAPRSEDCFAYTDRQPRETQHPVYLWSSHPASYDIRILPNPIDDPGTVDIIGFGNADPEHLEFLRWTEDAVEGRLATSAWPRACFVIPEHPDDTSYVVEVEATSFLGETASRTYIFEVPEGRRPSVSYEPFSDHDVRVYVPITASQSAAVTVIDADDPTSCSEVEADGRARFGSILPSADGRFIMDWGRQALTGARAATEPLDPAYDAHQVVNVMGLSSGTRYRLCVWWLEGPDRSFSEASIVEREVHWFTTPDRPTALIEYFSVQNTSGRSVEAGEYRITAACPGGGTVAVPDVRLDNNEATGTPLDARPVLCDYDGRRAPAAVVVRAVTEAYTKEFSIPLTASWIPFVGVRAVFFDVDLADGDRDPGSLDVSFLVTYRWASGGAGFGADWGFGLTGAFEPDPEDPAVLDDIIRIDIFASGVSPDGRDGIRVNAAFDRPVRLSAWVLPHRLFTSLTGEDPLCLTGERPTISVDTLSESHSFRLGGLCTLTAYTVVIEAEDEAGNRGVFTDMTVPAALFVAGTNVFSDFDATGHTDGYHVNYFVENSAASTLSAVFTNAFEVSVQGVDWDMRRSNRCLSENRVGTPGFELGLPRTAVWADEVAVTIYFEADEASFAGSDGCASLGWGHSLWRASITATFSIEDFERGVTIPVSASEVTGAIGGRPVDFNVIIRGSVTD